MKRKSLIIDSTTGGNGDIWMRLVAFYTVAGLRPDLEVKILIPTFLRRLAILTFGERLVILNDSKNSIDLHFTCLGFKDLISGIIKGRKYIAPYHRAVIHDKRKRHLKDFINLIIFTVTDFLGIIQVPEWKWIESYMGYMDIIGIKVLRRISYQQFVQQLCDDYNKIYSRLNGDIPLSPELFIPNDLKDHTLVFANGTSRQFVPVWWAKTYLPNAYFAFFYKDEEALLFKGQGLKTILFYHEPGDIISLARKAKWIISTDSFPSHLLQYSTQNCSILITEVLKSKVISPAFRGKVIDAEVKCHPCLHMERKSRPTCAEGYADCLNWVNDRYISNVLKSIPNSKTIS